MHGLRFGKVFIVTHMKAFFLSFSLAASTLVTSAFGQRSVGLQPTLKPPTTCKKKSSGDQVQYNSVSVFGFLFEP